ncbi:Bug family tripartite tricarboxylate transporter substrate binding protein [Aquibaculum sediminis]|uniref:Bug family tripartite tricarboxylate transporter substrate binding protein n=1 Tax=Aquibaculum sediminis TaxID=3231907 RepID=UPI0034548940
MLRRTMLGFAGTLALGVAATVTMAQPAEAYPDRPITIIVPWGAGGGTDATARIIASVLEGELDTSVNVVNRTGGSGVVGHTAIAEADPDGYTLGLATVEINMMHWQGLTDLTWEGYTPLTLMNEDPASVNVPVDSPYETLQDLLDAIEENPGGFQASGTGQGGIWHLALAGMLYDLGYEPNAVGWVPSDGAASGLQDMVAGGVDLVPCSLPEARSLIDAERVKSLALMSNERADLYPDLPTLKEETDSDWTMGAWRGIVGPAGLPQEVVDTLIPALEAVYNSDDYQEFMASQGYGIRWAAGDDFAEFMDQSNQSMGDIMGAVGLRKD